MIRVTVYAGFGPDDLTGPYQPETTSAVVAERDVHEHLRQLGLEWRTADYFPSRQTIIVLDPMPDVDEPDVRGLVREAASKLESTGLL